MPNPIKWPRRLWGYLSHFDTAITIQQWGISLLTGAGFSFGAFLIDLDWFFISFFGLAITAIAFVIVNQWTWKRDKLWQEGKTNRAKHETFKSEVKELAHELHALRSQDEAVPVTQPVMTLVADIQLFYPSAGWAHGNCSNLDIPPSTPFLVTCTFVKEEDAGRDSVSLQFGLKLNDTPIGQDIDLVWREEIEQKVIKWIMEPVDENQTRPVLVEWSGRLTSTEFRSEENPAQAIKSVTLYGNESSKNIYHSISLSRMTVHIWPT